MKRKNKKITPKKEESLKVLESEPVEDTQPLKVKPVLTHNVKPMDGVNKKPLSIDELMKVVSENKEVADKVFWEMATKIYDKTALKFISVLDHELQYHILRHLLVLNWVDEFYNKIKIVINLSVDGTGIKAVPEYIGDVTKKMQNSFNQSIEDTLSLTISKDGRGRNDAIQLAQSAEDRVLRRQMQEQQKNSLWNKFT